MPSYIQESFKYKSEQQIDDGIAKLPDEDIIKYLEATGNDTDDEVLATSVPETELPAQQDYLLNEKTLDIYLDQTEGKN